MKFIIRKTSLLLFLLLLVAAPIVAAQDVCEPLTADLVQSLQEACTNLEAGFACTLEEPEQALEGSELAAPVLVKLPAADASINLLLLGDAVLNVVAAEAPQVTLNATNGKGYNVNLRTGPSSDFDQAGIFSYDDTAIADGRDSSGEWIRLQADEGIAWISKSLIVLDGDAMTLPIVQRDASGAASALTLGLTTSSDEPCQTSGLLISYESEKAAMLQINEAILQLTESLVFVQSQDDQLELTNLSGAVNLLSGETPIESNSGDVIFVSDNNGELQETAYPFALLMNLPLSLITKTALACTTGVLEDSDVVMSHWQPDAETEEAFAVSADTHYLIEQQSEDGLWWRVSDGEESIWILQAAVQTIGDCENVPTQALVQNTPVPVSSVPTGDPAQVIHGYLQARVEGNTAQMQTLSCSNWDSQAVIQSQSFRAMNAELQNVSCTTSSQGDTSAIVTCSGNILTNYNNQVREWALGSYSMVAEGGEWRMCGES